MNLRSIRQARGLSQSKLARRLDVEPARISALERGKYPPTLNTLRRLATALECSVADLLPEEDARRTMPEGCNHG